MPVLLLSILIVCFPVLTPPTIYKWAQERRIPAVKLGKEWRFRKNILYRWLDEQIVSGPPGFAKLRGGA